MPWWFSPWFHQWEKRLEELCINPVGQQLVMYLMLKTGFHLLEPWDPFSGLRLRRDGIQLIKWDNSIFANKFANQNHVKMWWTRLSSKGCRQSRQDRLPHQQARAAEGPSQSVHKNKEVPTGQHNYTILRNAHNWVPIWTTRILTHAAHQQVNKTELDSCQHTVVPSQRSKGHKLEYWQVHLNVRKIFLL